MSILLNDILKITDVRNTKIRFVSPSGTTDPMLLFKENHEELMRWLFLNYKKNKSFYKGQVAIGFVRIERDKWLLFDISRITKDLNILDGVGYEYETLDEYKKYFGRLVVEYKNRSQQMIRNAESVINARFFRYWKTLLTMIFSPDMKT